MRWSALVLLLVCALAHANAPGVKELADAKPEVRRQAADRLGALLADNPKSADAPEIIRALERALSDTEYGVRTAVLDAIERAPSTLADGALIEALLARLDDETAGVRERAAMLIGQSGDRRALVPLVGRLSDASRDVRLAVVFALGRLGDARAENAIVRALRTDPAIEVRAEAITALDRIGGPASLAALKETVRAPEERLRARAFEALGNLGARGIDGVGRELVAALDRIDSMLLAASALERMGKHATPALTEGLLRATASTAPRVVALLGGTGDSTCEDALLDAYAKEASLLPHVVDALGQLQGTRSSRALLVLAEALDASDVTLRRRAARAMANIADPHLDAVRLRHLDDADLEVRRAVLEQAGRHRIARAVDGILAQTQRDEATARVAARALGEYQNNRTRTALIALLDHTTPSLRRAAADALAHDPNESVLRALAPRLAQSTPGRADVLIALLGASARHPRSAPHPELVSIAQRGPDLDAARALCLLSVVAAPESAAAVAKLARNRSRSLGVRRAALAALASFPAVARAALEDALSDSDISVRAEAAWSLGKLAPSPSSTERLRLAARTRASTFADNAAQALLPSERPDVSAQTWLAFRLVDRDDAPLLDAPYTLRLADGRMRHGITDGGGIVCESKVPRGDAALIAVTPRPAP